MCFLSTHIEAYRRQFCGMSVSTLISFGSWEMGPYGNGLFHLNHLGNILPSLIKLVYSPVRFKIDHPTIISRRIDDISLKKSINIYWIFTRSRELLSESSSFAINQVIFINDSERFRMKLELLISTRNGNGFWLGSAGHLALDFRKRTKSNQLELRQCWWGLERARGDGGPPPLVCGALVSSIPQAPEEFSALWHRPHARGLLWSAGQIRRWGWWAHRPGVPGDRRVSP